MDKFLIDNILDDMAVEERKHFSPHYVCNRAGETNLKEVTEHLLYLVGYKLKVYFEVECPEGDSDFAVSHPSQIEKKVRTCSICGVEYIPDENRIWVAFDFLPEYVDVVKKKPLLSRTNLPASTHQMLIYQ